jgi:CRISPR-associated endonuclease/helicase Cas3
VGNGKVANRGQAARSRADEASMTAIDFASAFESLTGHAPFGWQRRLFDDHFVKGDVPAALDLPTGLGKTSVMAIWLIARAHGAKLPRRLVYVVDRRVVVDQATAEAERLRENLDGMPSLKTSLGLGDRSLSISTLRGQFVDNRAWLEDPAAPAIVVGTVDMIGSRLLFQGYNVSTRMRPVHAAFLGVDAFIVLDEAHLVPPFEALVRQVKELTKEDQNRAPFRIPELHRMNLSATGRDTGGAAFTLQQEDEEDEPVRKRLSAPKWLRLDPLPADANLAETLVARAWERGMDGRRVIVFSDSRSVAQKVRDGLERNLGKQLKEKFEKNAPNPTDFVDLIVGARRVREREELARSEVFKRFSPKTAREANAAAPAGVPAFLVATSAGEVGIDIDADHMVSDLVPWERMVQRLGRVNRMGDFSEGSLIDILVVTSDKDKETEAPAGPVEIEARRAPFVSPIWQPDKDDRRDASPGALRRLRNNHEFSALVDGATTPEPLRPALNRALVDAWSMTSLEEHPGRPDVAPWIRGWPNENEEPQTRIVWRRHLPIRADDDSPAAMRAVTLFLDEAPPNLGEILETYTSSVVALMRTRAKTLLKILEAGAADARGDADEIGAANSSPAANSFVALVLSPKRKPERLLRLSQIEETDAGQLRTMIAHRTVILDARLGGLDIGGLLDPKANASPATLDGKIVSLIEQESADALWSEERLKAKSIGFRVRHCSHNVADDGWRVSYQRFVEADDVEAGDDSSAPEWRVEDWVNDGAARSDLALTKTKQAISKHHKRAEFWADAIGQRLSLPAVEHSILKRATAVHDLGKMRRNWQAYAGNHGYPRTPTEPEPLAKFAKRGNPALLKIGDRTYRHEFGTLRDVIDQKSFDGLPEAVRDLALHLIAAHHGNARPMIPPVDEKDPPAVSANLARDTALRFLRVQRQWGAWGLAWLEVLLRSSDVIASREVSKPEENS